MSWDISHMFGNLFHRDPSKSVVIKNLSDSGDLMMISGAPGAIIQHRPDPDFYRRQAMQQMAQQQNQYEQLRGQQQMGVATGAAAGILAIRPGMGVPVDPKPAVEEPVTETKTEVHAAHEPELEEIIKEDGSTIVRLKK